MIIRALEMKTAAAARPLGVRAFDGMIVSSCSDRSPRATLAPWLYEQLGRADHLSILSAENKPVFEKIRKNSAPKQWPTQQTSRRKTTSKHRPPIPYLGARIVLLSLWRRVPNLEPALLLLP